MGWTPLPTQLLPTLALPQVCPRRSQQRPQGGAQGSIHLELSGACNGGRAAGRPGGHPRVACPQVQLSQPQYCSTALHSCAGMVVKHGRGTPDRSTPIVPVTGRWSTT